MRTVLAIALLIVSSFCYANQNYYPESTLAIIQNPHSNRTQLKEALFDLLSKVHIKHENARDTLANVCPINAKCLTENYNLSYKQAREILFGKLHLEKNNNAFFVKDVYCNKIITEKSGAGEGKIPDSNLINCEHTWPQSRFSKEFSNNQQKTDLHHLYPTDMRANSTRSNNIFANVDGRVVNSSCLDSKTGTETLSGQTAFEPPIEHRGNVARAIFYFATRYKMTIPPSERVYLTKWNLEDPVDEAEMIRNNMIMDIQGNRNPFIDFPELLDRL